MKQDAKQRRKYPRLNEISRAQFHITQYVQSHGSHPHLAKALFILNTELGRSKGFDLTEGRIIEPPEAG